jgi:hypothetical protein
MAEGIVAWLLLVLAPGRQSPALLTAMPPAQAAVTTIINTGSLTRGITESVRLLN